MIWAGDFFETSDSDHFGTHNFFDGSILSWHPCDAGYQCILRMRH